MAGKKQKKDHKAEAQQQETEPFKERNDALFLFFGIMFVVAGCMLINAPPKPDAQGLAANLSFIDYLAPAFLLTLTGLILTGVYLWRRNKK